MNNYFEYSDAKQVIVSGDIHGDFKGVVFKLCIDYEAVPAWQRWGTGLYLEKVERRGLNPKTGNVEVGYGNSIKVDFALPVGVPYGEMVLSLVSPSFIKAQRHWR